MNVSVLIPTYNRARLLPETIESILAQRYAAAEVIVVDDGSTDDTAERMRAYPGVKYHRIANGGVCRARNVAASLATSSHLAYCDSDDLWRDDKLEKQMAFHERYPDAAFSFTNFSTVTDGVWSAKSKLDDSRRNRFAERETELAYATVCERPLYNEILKFQPIFPSTVVMSRALFDRVGGFVDSLGRVLSEDLEFILRCVQSAPIGVITEPMVGIRKHSSNVSGDLFATVRGEIDVLRYASSHHTITASNREALEEEIMLRRVSAADLAFGLGRFDLLKELMVDVPGRFLNPKLRLKLAIAHSPEKIGRGLKRLLVRS